MKKTCEHLNSLIETIANMENLEDKKKAIDNTYILINELREKEMEKQMRFEDFLTEKTEELDQLELTL